MRPHSPEPRLAWAPRDRDVASGSQTACMLHGITWFRILGTRKSPRQPTNKHAVHHRRGDTTTRALSACLPRASTGPASPGRSNARRRSCSGCYLPHAREVVSQCSGCSVWRNVWRSPPVHDVGRRSIVLADSCATLAPRAVTLVQLARCASASAHDLHTRRDTSPKCGMC